MDRKIYLYGPRIIWFDTCYKHSVSRDDNNSFFYKCFLKYVNIVWELATMTEMNVNISWAEENDHKVRIYDYFIKEYKLSVAHLLEKKRITRDFKM